jgi:hypothetical protein
MTIATHERIGLDDIDKLLTENGSAPRRSSGAKLVVPLRATPPHLAEIESTAASDLRLSVLVADIEAWARASRAALARFFVHVNAAVRLSEATIEGALARFEVRFRSKPSAEDLARGLAALEATTYLHIHEARALGNETLARIFLSNQSRQRRHEP